MCISYGSQNPETNQECAIKGQVDGILPDNALLQGQPVFALSYLGQQFWGSTLNVRGELLWATSAALMSTVDLRRELSRNLRDAECLEITVELLLLLT